MKYRTALLLAGEDVQSAGTKVIDIDVQSPISSIDIMFKITKGTEDMLAGVPACITKIEIVDGAKVIYSANGYLNQALGYYNRPGRQLEQGQHLINNAEEAHYPIDFGRYLWDEQLAFDPRKFTNPQLRITHNELATDALASANELEVTLQLFDEKVISPIGFLAGILHHDYTAGANNSFETISLPDDRVIRQILVRAYYDAFEPWYNIKEARLDENTLGNIIFEYRNLENYFEMMKSVWHAIDLPIVIQASNSGRTAYVPTTDYWSNFLGVQQSGTDDPYVDAGSGRGGKIIVKATGSLQGVNGRVHGRLPWHCYQFPMGKLDDLDDWYDPLGKKPRLRLRAGTGGTNVTGQVLLEELVRY